MEPQVLVCSADVAAFVDALETIGYPVADHPVTVIEQQAVADVEDTVDEQEITETFLIDEDQIVESEEIAHTPVKRYRMNPKEHKEVIEMLFEKQKAIVTEKAFMNLKGNKRFKSDVWSWFGDVKLLISRSEAKQLKIPFYFRMCGEERMMLSKLFVGCFRCNALFIHNSQRSGTSTLRSHMRNCSRPRPRKKKGAPTIIFFPTKAGTQKATRNASEDDKLLAKEHLLDFILSSNSSFNIVDEGEFQNLLQLCISIGSTLGDVNVESMLCPPEKLSEFMLNDLYMTCTNAFYTEFQYIYGASYSTNIWMDEHQKSTYLSVMCHYATSAGALKCVILHTEEFNLESKTPYNVQDTFASMLQDMAVVPTKRLIVTDNLSNTVISFKDEECVRCASQNLNLALQAVMQKILSASQTDFADFLAIVNSCKDIISYFEQISFQYQLVEPLKIYKEDSWTSVIAMFRSINNQYEDILTILNDTGETHLMSVDKSVISTLIQLFQLFEDALLEFSNTSEPTLNIIIPWLTKIQNHCTTQADDTIPIHQLKAAIAAEINERLTSNVTLYHRIATLLDPRFKRLAYNRRDDQIAANLKTKSLVKECMEAPLLEDVDRFGDGSGRDRMSDLYSSHHGDTGNSEKVSQREVDNYLVEPFNLSNQHLDQDQKFNPLKFWADNSEKYPNLCKVAMWILSCPATCVEKEDIFWNNEWMVNCCRIHQKSEHVNKVLFVKSFKDM